MQHFGIGQAVRRGEDVRFLTGRGRYVTDLSVPGMVWAAVVLSPHPHARILSVDASAALAEPGVLAVLTGADVAADGIGPFVAHIAFPGVTAARTPRPILARDTVRHVGDRVALVLAETQAAAQAAADLVEVDYDPLPAAPTLDAATADGAPAVWADAPGNVSFVLRQGDAAATDAAFAGASVTVTLDLTNTRVAMSAIEPRAALAQFDPSDGTYTLHAATQNPHGLRDMLARDVLRVPAAALRVIAPDVGGGFGLKAEAHPEDALVLWAARRVGRPVKWVATRAESFLGDYHGRDQRLTATIAADADGRVRAVRMRALHGVGAYHTSVGAVPLISSLRYVPGVYAIPAVDLETRAVFTHTSPVGVYRGAGRPEAAYAIERLMDALADRLGADPADLRRRNMIPPAAMPYTSAVGAVYDSGDFPGLFARALALADWDGFPARAAASRARGLLRGRGIGMFIEHAGVYNDRMELRFDPSGGLTILAGTHSHGQGHATAWAQIVHSLLGVPFDRIRLVQGDTETVEYGRGTYAARSSLIASGALRQAADRILAKAQPMAAHLLGVDAGSVAFADGLFSAPGTNRSLALHEVAQAFFAPRGLPPGFDLGLSAAGTSSEPPNFPNGAHVCEVEVDPETGAVAIARYTVVDDVGVAINPLLIEGQVQGGLAQGIGQALLEHCIYDAGTGQLMTGSFMDYAMPRAADFGPLVTECYNVPCPTNPLGVKGCGESGTIGAPPAVMNAVIDALRPLGVTHLDMPASPGRVWAAIAAAAGETAG